MWFWPICGGTIYYTATMMTATTMAGERVDFYKDVNTTKTPTVRTMLASFFDTKTNLWLDDAV